MAIKDDPITKADIDKYLQSESDFAFEISVLQSLREIENLHCQHSGTFRDSVTDKRRQFDIRAIYKHGPKRYRLSIECKNIRDYCPILVHSVLREPSESFNDLIVSFEYEQKHRVSVQRLSEYSSLYQPREFVAKATDQIGYKGDGKFLSSDCQVYEKLDQAIASAYDLFLQAQEAPKEPYTRIVTSIMPVLVVPDGRLWEVRYDQVGTILQEATQVDQVSYFLANDWMSATKHDVVKYTVSHIEIVTASALKKFLNEKLILNLTYWNSDSAL